jgi:hypothetical protein
MEAHPVPKNVLDVEFKLFGSLSVRQFGKVLVGSLAALGLYLLTNSLGLPILITGPIMVALVLVGVASALIPAFEIRLSAIIKSMFVSPRYVWQKDKKLPDIFAGQARRDVQKVTNAQSTKRSPANMSIDDLSIDQILAARSIYSKEVGDNQGVEGANFSRVYDQYFAGSETTIKTPNPAIAQVAVATPDQTTGSTPQQAKEKLVELQQKLAELNKTEGAAAEKAEVIAQINEQFATLGLSTPPKQPQTAMLGVELEAPHVNVFGVVVNKKDQPIGGATIKLEDLNQKLLGINTISAEDGRFSLAVPQQLTEVVIAIEKEGFRFHPFKLKLDSDKLPAFKFREH